MNDNMIKNSRWYCWNMAHKNVQTEQFKKQYDEKFKGLYKCECNDYPRLLPKYNGRYTGKLDALIGHSNEFNHYTKYHGYKPKPELWMIIRTDTISGISVILMTGFSTWIKASDIVNKRYSNYNGIQKITIMPYIDE